MKSATRSSLNEIEPAAASRLLIGKSKPKVKIRQEQGRGGRGRETGHRFRLMVSLMLVIVLCYAKPPVTGLLVLGHSTGRATDELARIPLSAIAANQSSPLEAPAPAPAPATPKATPRTRTSELSFEFLNLKTIPSDQLCKIEGQNQVDSVSFASNQIRTINSSAFICISVRLKILNLSNNKIESISDEAFKGLEQLQVLILDANRLVQLPAAQVNSSRLPSLRHINLARNRIGSIGLADQLDGPNLISLDLKGNPLKSIHWQSLGKLSKLKTLTLSQVNIQTSHLQRFDGLPELRFLHLDQFGPRLSSLEGHFCETSRKLASLSLRSNQLEQVPQFANCHGLLSLDLSYNRIGGSLEGNLSQLANLIDLYLGHNELEHIGEHAFAGLGNLQVLELEGNKLKTIHPQAFLAVRTSLYELNIAKNPQLTQLTSAGLDQLVVLKSYGNKQLRKLPAYLPSAKLLALTYAYHCCDYYATAGQPTLDGLPQAATNNNTLSLEQSYNQQGSARTTDHTDQEREPLRQSWSDRTADGADSGQDPQEWLLPRLANLILSKLAPFWWGPSTGRPGDELAVVSNHLGHRAGAPAAAHAQQEDVTNSENTSEFVLWPQRGEYFTKMNISQQQQQQQQQLQLQLQLQQGQHDKPPTERQLDEPQPEIVTRRRRVPEVARAQGERLRGVSARALQRGQSDEGAPSLPVLGVIDELIWQMKRIRRAHQGASSVDPIMQRDDSDGGADDAGPPNQLLDDELSTVLTCGPQDDGTKMDLADDDDDDDDEDLDYQADLVARELQRVQVGRAGSLARARRHNNRDHRDERSPFPVDSRRQQQHRQQSTGVQCLPRPDAFQPCLDLFDSIWLRASIWLVFLCAFTGNILVIVVLGSVRPSSSTSALTSIMWFNAAHSKRHIDVPRFLVLNLAVADLLMAVYLGLLAFVDLSTLGEFKKHAIQWQHSTGCKLAGFLAVLSSELSVFILAIITLERNYAITNAVHLNRRLSLQKAMLVMFFGYVYALAMALMPLNGINDYKRFSICLPLEFEPEVGLNSASNLYLISLIGINTLSFVLLLSCYLRMYWAIRGSQAWNTNDLKIAKRMSILVLTDFLCWSPIICVALLALFGRLLVGAEALKVLIIFVLPLNSVANPFLYAITTKKFKRDLALLKRRLRVEQTLQLLGLACTSLVATCGCRQARHPADSCQVAGTTRDLERVYYRKHRKQAGLGGDETHATSNRRARSKVGATLAQDRQPGRRTRTTSRCARMAQFQSFNRAESDDLIGNKLVGGLTHTCRACRNRIMMTTTTTAPAPLGPTSLSLHQARLQVSASDCGEQQIVFLAAGHKQTTTTTTSTRPRIVLEAVEPVVGVALAPLRLADADRGSGVLLARGLNSLELGGRTSSQPLQDDSPSSLSMVNYGPCCRPAVARQQKLAASDTIDQKLNYSPLSGQPNEARASSADNPNATASPSKHPMSVVANQATCRQFKSNRKQVANSLTGLLPESHNYDSHNYNNNSNNNDKARSVTIRHNSSTHVDHLEEAANRAASAGASNWPSSSAPKSVQVGSHFDLDQERPGNHLSLQPAICCSCSCEMIRQTRGGARKVLSCQGGDLDKRAQLVGDEQSRAEGGCGRQQRTSSINRLVFEPLIKAWSTLQLSLQSGLASTASNYNNNNNNYNNSATPSQPVDCKAATARTTTLNIEHDRDQHSPDEQEDLISLDQENTIIDDILQLSSPAKRRLLRDGCRRMSRSCDIVIEQSASGVHRSSISGAGGTTSTTEPTSSSFYDQSDDQRILLATINQLNSRRYKRKDAHHMKPPRLVQTTAHGQNQQVRLSGGKRASFTRCRSWSPALLGKLEDCMHQIRCRIPKFGAGHDRDTDHYDGIHFEAMNEQPTSTSGDDGAHTGIGPQVVGQHETSSESDEPPSSESSLSSSEEPIDDDHDHEEDEFNEIGLADWTRNMQKKAPSNCYGKPASRQRLHQQLSGNSDTLSARTIGTTLTSVSFDSNSNIPATVNSASDNQTASVQPSVSSSRLSGRPGSFNSNHGGHGTPEREGENLDGMDCLMMNHP